MTRTEVDVDTPGNGGL